MRNNWLICIMVLLIASLLAGCAAQQPAQPNLPTTLEGWEARAKASPGNWDNQLSLAFEYMRHGRYDEAAEAYKKSYSGNSSHAEHSAMNLAAGAYRKAGKLDAAIAAQKRAVELKPNDADYYSFLGLLYYETKKYDESITAAKQAISLQPTHAAAHNIAGAAYQDKGVAQEAIAYLRKATELAPKEYGNYTRLGNVFIGEKRLAEALAAFSKAVELAPENAQPVNGVGIVYYFMGRYDEAISHITRAIELTTFYGVGMSFNSGHFPTITSVMDGLPAARAGLKKGDLIIAANGQSMQNLGGDVSKLVQIVRGAAGTTVSLTVERDGKRTDVTLAREKINMDESAVYYGGRSFCYGAKADGAKAMEDARAAIAVNPKEVNAILALANAQLLQGQFELTLQTTSPVSSNLSALLLQASALAKLSRHQEAAKVYSTINLSHTYLSFAPFESRHKALLDAMRPYVAENVSRAKAFESKGQHREALAAYSDALKAADRNDSRAILSACFAMVRKNPALGQVPEEARKYAIRSEVRVKEGNFSEAFAEIRKAINEAPYIGQFYFNAALIQSEMKLYREAIDSMNMFLAAAPDSPHARAAKDEIIKWEMQTEKGK